MVKMFEVISFVVILIFIYFGFYITFNTVQVISQWVVLWECKVYEFLLNI